MKRRECLLKTKPITWAILESDNGHVISYHFMAISLGNIPYNIIWMPLSVKAAAEGDREREREQKACRSITWAYIFNGFSCINEYGTWWRDPHSWFFFVCAAKTRSRSSVHSWQLYCYSRTGSLVVFYTAPLLKCSWKFSILFYLSPSYNLLLENFALRTNIQHSLSCYWVLFLNEAQ